MAQNKRQHWVPQFYLRYFATAATAGSNEPQIWATPLDEGGRDPFKVGVGNIAARSFLYSPLQSNGSRDDTLDRKLQDIESLLAQLWPEIANDHYHMNDSVRRGLSLFLATLLLRNPAAETRTQEAHELLVNLIESGPKDAIGNPLPGSININGSLSPFDPADWPRFRNASKADLHREFVTNIEQSAGSIAMLLFAKMPWWVCYSTEPVFATSDHPVVCWNEDSKVPGITRSDTIVYFPFSPTRMLVIGDDSNAHNSANPLVSGGHGFFNQFVFREARRWLFTCCEPTPIIENMQIHMDALAGRLSPNELIQVLRSRT